MSHNHLLLNAAIEKLIAQDDADGEAAQVVISYGAKLKAASSIQIESTTISSSSGPSMSGYSPNVGHVTVKDKVGKTVKEQTFGVDKERVGHYRLWKAKEGCLNFHHFWKSLVTTGSMDGILPDVYHLGYDPQSLEPAYLAILRKRTVFRVFVGITIEIFVPYLEPVYGKTPPMKGWGLSWGSGLH
jgi:hypothetical protein